MFCYIGFIFSEVTLCAMERDFKKICSNYYEMLLEAGIVTMVIWAWCQPSGFLY